MFKMHVVERYQFLCTKNVAKSPELNQTLIYITYSKLLNLISTSTLVVTSRKSNACSVFALQAWLGASRSRRSSPVRSAERKGKRYGKAFFIKWKFHVTSLPRLHFTSTLVATSQRFTLVTYLHRCLSSRFLYLACLKVKFEICNFFQNVWCSYFSSD